MSMLKPTVAAVALTLGLATGAIAEDLAHVQQLLSTKKCSGCDLTSAGLVLARLPGADLSNANLAGANLSQANLVGANLAGANLVGVSLVGANLAGANLVGANLVGVDLRNTYLAGADLTDAKLTNANIQDAVGLSKDVGTADEFYQWAMAAGKEKRYELSLQYFNKALVRNPDLAAAFLGRGMSKIQLGDEKGALEDLDGAAILFEKQGKLTDAETTKKVAAELRKPPKKRGGGGFGQALVGLAGTFLQLFLGF
ncbi:pentapeptide repeat-containing protein [filamentous cyanobacterium LEGE 11480]|uniref:Pentapeptide repeat-containing protein n=1 Tax=Romeriopsis navalis LEGE 11480 TaxID=2777977 RepID=A0A928VT35_9CYAN|nr:pentapeptide repeat-containing protein [Romeriopsis navalis]MBE9031739.1 pentapeptide repeat-containing protein [Romeriopsis navalis LEGE 11480]